MKAEKIGPEIIEHWYTLVPTQQFSTKEFYDDVEAEIAAQKVPALEISRVDLSEGGILSDKREYLRMRRERLTFDVCAAPVGVNYFFSYRFYVESAVVKAWEILALFAVLGALWYILAKVAGTLSGLLILFAMCAAVVVIMRTAVGEGMRDLDASLIAQPIIGPIYERFYRKDTYYRQDMRMAYCSIVAAIVKMKVEKVTAAKGVTLVREFTYSPVFDDLYKVRNLSPRATAEGS